MKPQIKFYTCSLLAPVLAAAMLAGCSADPAGQPSGTGSAAAPAASGTPSGNIKMDTIRVMTNQGDTKEVVTRLVDEFNKGTGKEKGIVIEYTVEGGDYKNVIDMALASGQAPDMFNVQGSRYPYIQAGNLMALEDLPLSKGFLEQYKDKTSPMIEIFDGKTYALPFKLTTIGLIYNKELFKKAGLVDEKGEAKPPKTWTEVTDYAKKLTNPKEKVYGFALPIKWGGFWDWYVSPSVTPLGKPTFSNPDMKYDFSVMKQGLEWVMQLKKDQSYFPGAEGLDNDPARAQFAEGRIGMMMGASWDVGVLSDQFPTKSDWGVAAIPLYEGQTGRYKQNATRESFVEVSSAAKKNNLEKVAIVYEWFNSKEFISRLYEEGQIIPLDSAYIQNTKVKNNKKGWEDFAKLAEVSRGSQLPQPSGLKLEGDTPTQVYNKIWAGVVSIDDGLADLTKRYNAALQTAIASGTVKPELLKLPLPEEWKLK
ncbi:MAG: extracellular solute-binding protein family 1 [Paenibacillaceae bacterium]|nr:extracellular solute-binding protein family 1 [Paenibacillaceae bacterium]